MLYLEVVRVLLPLHKSSLALDEDVVEFDVSMHYIVPRYMSQAFDDLPDNILSFRDAQDAFLRLCVLPLPLLYELSQVALVAKFKKQVQGASVRKSPIKFHHISVLGQVLEDLYLLLCVLGPCCHLFAGQ